MKNAITMSNQYHWRECSSFRELAHVLLHEVHLEERMIKAHGRVVLDVSLLHPDWDPADTIDSSVIWMLIDDGLLLVRWPFDLWKGGYQRNFPLTLWIPDIEHNRSPLVEFCLQAIFKAKIGRVTEKYEAGDIKQEVNLQVNSILLLQDDLNLYAFPFDDIPGGHLLSDDKSEELHALGIRFTEPEYTGYLDLMHCDLFVQGPDWRYSRFPWLKREPRLATGEYAYMVLVAGKEGSTLACDGSERRECLFCEQFAGYAIDVIHRLVFRAAETGDWPYEPYFNSREVWQQAKEDWQVILSHDDWESLFETLCRPDYEQHTIDTSWLNFINNGYRSDYRLMKKALQYLCEWVELVLETEEGVTAYCIW